MSIFSAQTLSSDLNHMLSQRGETLVGVSPSAIAGTIFTISFDSIREGNVDEGQGRETEVETSVVLNARLYSSLPAQGAILETTDQKRRFKVARVSSDNHDPISVRLNLTSISE